LAEIGVRIDEAHLRPPVVLIVGAVASLADRLAWYEALPLFGKRIVVTRARHQADELSALLEHQGAEVVEFPVIEILGPDDPSELEDVYHRLGTYDWLVLTSVNGVDRFLGGLLAGGHDIRELAGVDIAAIGPSTAAAIRRYGLCVAAQPSEFRAEALVEALGEVRERRMLVARAAVARDVLPGELRRRGAVVDVVAVYRTILPSSLPDPASLGPFDVITFTSSSTVKNFLAIVGEPAHEMLAGTVAAAIGPITAQALEDAGLHCDLMPADYTVAALADAIGGYFANRKSVK
jgi:uroporphyrinogen III methyltransferase/synthase